MTDEGKPQAQSSSNTFYVVNLFSINFTNTYTSGMANESRATLSKSILSQSRRERLVFSISLIWAENAETMIQNKDPPLKLRPILHVANMINVTVKNNHFNLRKYTGT